MRNHECIQKKKITSLPWKPVGGLLKSWLNLGWIIDHSILPPLFLQKALSFSIDCKVHFLLPDPAWHGLSLCLASGRLSYLPSTIVPMFCVCFY